MQPVVLPIAVCDGSSRQPDGTRTICNQIFVRFVRSRTVIVQRLIGNHLRSGGDLLPVVLRQKFLIGRNIQVIQCKYCNTGCPTDYRFAIPAHQCIGQCCKLFLVRIVYLNALETIDLLPHRGGIGHLQTANQGIGNVNLHFLAVVLNAHVGVGFIVKRCSLGQIKRENIVAHLRAPFGIVSFDVHAEPVFVTVQKDTAVSDGI